MGRRAREARGTYVAYLDDDLEVDPTWLASMFRACEVKKPDFCCGPIYSLFRVPKPYWFREEWEMFGYLGDTPHQTDETVYDGNLAVRRELLTELGGFRENFGMSGQKIAYGEETDFHSRAKRAMPNLVVWYIPTASVHHEVAPVKFVISRRLRSAWAGGRDCFYLGMWKEALRSRPRVAVRLAKETLVLASRCLCVVGIMLADLFRPSRSKWRRFVQEAMIKHVVALSAYYHALRQPPEDADKAGDGPSLG